MDYAIYITPSALADITMAKDYYNSKSDGLGKRMANEVDLILHKVVENPKTYSKRYREIRVGKIATFPYLVHYKIIEKSKQIHVLRVFNTHQKPTWKD